jgi:hypothetical protein
MVHLLSFGVSLLCSGMNSPDAFMVQASVGVHHCPFMGGVVPVCPLGGTVWPAISLRGVRHLSPGGPNTNPTLFVHCILEDASFLDGM